MKKPGRKSAASLAVVQVGWSNTTRPLPPRSLDKQASALWTSIMNAYPADHFAPGDLPLLREYVVTAETFLPVANSEAESGGASEQATRTMHVKTLGLLASKLRLNVAARSRPDAAAITSAHKDGGQGVEELARLLKGKKT